MKSMSFTTFMQKQHEIRGRLYSTPDGEVASQAHPLIAPGHGGYVVAYRYGNEVTDQVAALSERLAQFGPTLRYDAGNIHTTLATREVGQDFVLDRIKLADITRGVESARGQLRSCKFNFTEWLAGKDSVLAAGEAHWWLHGEIHRVVKAVDEKAWVSMNPTWGMYMVTSRPTEPLPLEQRAAYAAAVRETPVIGQVRPEAVEVSYFTCNPEGWVFHEGERFPL
jgi:hypothetical protein